MCIKSINTKIRYTKLVPKINHSEKISEKIFVDQLENWYTNKGYMTKREVNAGHGVADLVVTKLDKDQCKKRERNNQIKPLLKDKYFLALRYIPDIKDTKTPVDINYLIKRTGLSKNLLRYGILRELETNGYLLTLNKTTYKKINGWEPLSNEVVAVEAKLKDWKQGLLQAIRYNAFADYVYLAMPNLNNIDVERFKKFGIGLMLFHEGLGEPNIIIKAKKQRIISLDKRNLVLEYFWSKEIQYAECLANTSA